MARIFSSKRQINSRSPATSRPADQADWPAALSTVSAIHAFRLFPSVRAATVAARCTAGETLRGILPENGLSGACPRSAHFLLAHSRAARDRKGLQLNVRAFIGLQGAQATYQCPLVL